MLQQTFWQRNGRSLRSAVLIIIVALALLALTFTAFGQDAEPDNPLTGQDTGPQINQPQAVSSNTYGNPLPDEMGYQGQLVDANGNPQVGSYTMEFAVYTDPPTYTLSYKETQTVSTDQDGLFNVMIGSVQPGLGDALVEGNAWLEVKLDDEILAPRQPVGSVPYALYAHHLIGGTGLYSAIGGGFGNDASGTHGVVAGGVSNTAPGYAGAVTGGWRNHVVGDYTHIGGGGINDANGDYSIIGGGKFNDANGEFSTIGGGNANQADGMNSVIAGGDANETIGDLSTIGGGSENVTNHSWSTIGGGHANTTTWTGTTVGGGTRNSAILDGATVSGGIDNTSSGFYATISGGSNNEASGSDASIGGGANNIASGSFAAVPGGQLNTAAGDNSFAMGTEAYANHEGTFVWSDSSFRAQDFQSSAAHQFLIDAEGGVGITTNAPQSQLHVADNQNGTATNLSAHIATIENESTDTSPDVLALVTGAINPASSVNYITFFDSSGAMAAIEGNGSGGVTYKTSGADFAEYLPKQNRDDDLQPGDVVGLMADGVGRQTAVSTRVLVVSSAAGFVGNASEADNQEHMVLVAFMGQVPVRARGPVQAGDLLVASGLNDGTAVAIAPAELSPALANQIVGQALEKSDTEGESLVNTLVGLPTDAFWAARLRDTQAQLDDLAARLDALVAQIEADHE